MVQEKPQIHMFAEVIAKIQVEFVQKFTVGQFVKQLEAKYHELKKEKGFKIFPGFTKALTSYTVELKHHVNNTLYEFKFTYMDRIWMYFKKDKKNV